MTDHARALDLRVDVPWIPVIYLDGRRGTLALQPLLEQAHLIRTMNAEAVVWAGLMRFLPGVTALVARQDPRADFEVWGTDGMPQAAIDAALDEVGEHLWLRHPDTPFLQDSALKPGKEGNDPEWLLFAPAKNSKAWWGKDGDTKHRDAGTPARIAQGLVVAWFFSTGQSGKALGYYQDAPEDGWRPRGTLGFANHGLRMFWRGRNLAETLLANTMESHLHHGGRSGDNMPLWATVGQVRPGAGALTSSTWTGSTYLLAWDSDICVGVHTGGRRIPGLGTEKRADEVKAVEDGIWRADPTIPRIPIVKAGEETGDVRPIKPLHPSASAMEWAAEWYAASESRNAARAMEPGLVEVAEAEAFTIRVDGPPAGPDVTHLARVGGMSELVSARARSRLISLNTMTLSPIGTTLRVALIKALGVKAATPLQDRLFGAFCIEAEPVLDDVLHAEALTPDHGTAFANSAITAFERFIAPYTNSRTLAGTDGEGIAPALAYLHTRLNRIAAGEAESVQQPRRRKAA